MEESNPYYESIEHDTIVFCLQQSQVVQPKEIAAFLLDSYSQPHRKYHNLTHIQSLLQHLSGIPADVSVDIQLLYLCIWFHDVYYDAQSQDNEERSAVEFASCISNPVLRESGRKMILSTKKHLPLLDTLDCKVFLDLDLSILASTPQVYQSYVQAIREEYSMFSQEDFWRGRLRVIKGFLQRPRLYFSKWGQESFAEQAYHNLNNEMQQLLGK
ncbi:MAG: hypothetical protein AAF518_20915 [Spirochaetota bacterium]